MRWDAVQQAKLQELWQLRDAAGQPLYSRAAIAEMLGITRNALIGRLARCYAAGMMQRRAPEPLQRRGQQKPLQPLSVPPATIYRPPATPPPRACQWPLWGHRERPRAPVFCEAPAVRGAPYCQPHVNLAVSRR